jgi:hypothetical protein
VNFLGDTGQNILIGVVAALLTPVVLGVGRPLAKGAVKAGIVAGDWIGAAGAGACKQIGSLVSEARAEVARSATTTGESGPEQALTSQAAP